MSNKLIYNLRLIDNYMCKLIFNVLHLYFCLPRVRGKVELYRGKVDLTKIKTKI